MAGSPGPDGLKIRQLPDATVIRVLPYVPSSRAALWALGIGAALVLALGWATGARLLLPGALWTLACTAWAWARARRARQVLEVYVGKRQLELVWSREGRELQRRRLALAGIDTPRVDRRGVELPGPQRLHLPMEAHSDEARAWMAIHLGAAVVGARRRAGTSEAPHPPMSPP